MGARERSDGHVHPACPLFAGPRVAARAQCCPPPPLGPVRRRARAVPRSRKQSGGLRTPRLGLGRARRRRCPRACSGDIRWRGLGAVSRRSRHLQSQLPPWLRSPCGPQSRRRRRRRASALTRWEGSTAAGSRLRRAGRAGSCRGLWASSATARAGARARARARRRPRATRARSAGSAPTRARQSNGSKTMTLRRRRSWTGRTAGTRARRGRRGGATTGRRRRRTCTRASRGSSSSGRRRTRLLGARPPGPRAPEGRRALPPCPPRGMSILGEVGRTGS